MEISQGELEDKTKTIGDLETQLGTRYASTCIISGRFNTGLEYKVKTLSPLYKASFPLIAKVNSQARCENFHPITIFETNRCELASWLL